MKSESDDEIGLGLSDAIGQVRDQLEKAIIEGARSPVAFRAGPVDLEFEVAFARTGGIGGGLQLSVLSFGAHGDRTASHTHRVRVSLTPVDRDGRDKLIGEVGTGRETGGVSPNARSGDIGRD